jgi:hypothetical protein
MLHFDWSPDKSHILTAGQVRTVGKFVSFEEVAAVRVKLLLVAAASSTLPYSCNSALSVQCSIVLALFPDSAQFSNIEKVL